MNSNVQHNELQYSILIIMKRVLSRILIVGILFLISPLSHAQSLLDMPGSDPIIVRVTPLYPRPGQQIIVNIESFSVDLTRSTITWLENGKQIAEAIGQTSYYTVAGKSGTTQQIDIIVTTYDNRIVRKTITVSVGDVDLIWQAQSYTPPFYKGKALYPPQGDLIVVAIPHLIQNGKELDPKKLMYDWENDGTKLRAESGYGKNTLTIRGDFGSKVTTISVIVSSVDNAVNGGRQVTVTPTKPQFVLYEDSLLYGTVFNSALAGAFNLTNKEVRLKVIPYYFSTNASHSTAPLNFEWAVAGTESNETSNIITLRQTTGQPGVSSISVDAAHPGKIFQSAHEDVIVNFK
jgi:hypothetical protein